MLPSYGSTPHLSEDANELPERKYTLDVQILIFQRAIRMFVYAQTTLILVQFLKSLNITSSQAGLFMTLTLLGDVIISYVLTLYADMLGRRFVLAISALLMCVSGIVFVFSDNFIFLLLAAIVGVISPSGDETGPFKSVEEAVLAEVVKEQDLPGVLAVYSIGATVGNALGSISGGWIAEQLGMRTVFAIYAVVALMKFVTTLMLSYKCELTYDSVEIRKASTGWWSYITGDKLPPMVPQLLCFFAFDALGYGFLIPSWLVVYFTETFHLATHTLGYMLFITTLVGTLTSPLSAHLYHVIGPIKSMVLTHFPSALLITLIPLAPNLPIALTLLILRSCMNTMDVVPRTAFLAAVVPAQDRTRVLGLVNIVKTFARAIGPYFTGDLEENGQLALTFLIGGGLEMIYDASLFFTFGWIDKQFGH